MKVFNKLQRGDCNSYLFSRLTSGILRYEVVAPGKEVIAVGSNLSTGSFFLKRFKVWISFSLFWWSIVSSHYSSFSLVPGRQQTVWFRQGPFLVYLVPPRVSLFKYQISNSTSNTWLILLKPSEQRASLVEFLCQMPVDNIRFG